jgi:hypothetical protein
MSRSAAMVILALSVSGVPAVAAGAADQSAVLTPASVSGAAATVVAGAVAASAAGRHRVEQIGPGSPATHPAALPVLYGAFVGLQAFDGYSTMRGLSRGATESNGAVRGVTSNPAAFWSLKAVAATGPILLAEQMWRSNHRVGAVVLMIAANGIATAVAVNNARVLRTLR